MGAIYRLLVFINRGPGGSKEVTDEKNRITWSRVNFSSC